MVTEQESQSSPESKTPRKKVVQTHFTQNEYDKLRSYCTEKRYSMSEYVRLSVMDSLGREGKAT